VISLQAERYINLVIQVIQMIIETKVIRQGNSNVIVLPKETELKPKDKIKVLIVSDKTNKIKEISGMFRERLTKIDNDKALGEIKKELWGE